MYGPGEQSEQAHSIFLIPGGSDIIDNGFCGGVLPRFINLAMAACLVTAWTAVLLGVLLAGCCLGRLRADDIAPTVPGDEAVIPVTLCWQDRHVSVTKLRAKDTLTALEMNHGDTLEFQLRSGRVFRLTLEDTDAAIVERVDPGGIVYRFEARVRVDGLPMTLSRYVCSQECFYEPYVVNGVRLWLDTVRDVFGLIPVRYPRKGNLQCVPRKHARLALQDATLRICPQETRPWIDDQRKSLDVGQCYNGDDCYLGPYLGQACHVGMDINHPKGSFLFAPIDFDTHGYFNSLAAGDNNNRWRAIRQWANGDVWALQTHHLIELLMAEGGPLRAGTRYATTAGVHVGSHQHTHFEFKIGRPRRSKLPNPPDRVDAETKPIAAVIDFNDQSELAQAHPEVLHLDPWIVFWQTFEDRKQREGAIRAAMKPSSPARTGHPVTFASEGSRAARGSKAITCYWTFGDGGWQRGPEVTHVFARPAVYPVTLVVDDGQNRAACTQHISVTGESTSTPVFVLSASGVPSFHRRPVHALDVYGRPVKLIPHTLKFIARPSCPVPRSKVVKLQNVGGGVLANADPPRIEYDATDGWLTVVPQGEKNEQWLKVAVDAAGLQSGSYSAVVWITCGEAIGYRQGFRVELRLPDYPPESEVTIDDRDEGFYASPYSWVGHRFCRCPGDRRGYSGFYLTAGSRPLKPQSADGESARFTPDLKAGNYEVSLSEQTPFRADTELNVLVRHRRGEQRVRLKPDSSRKIGIFEFEEGTDGFVELHPAGSKGLVIADAVVFKLVGESVR